MLRKILNISLLFVAIVPSETTAELENYINNIRDDYCLDYCSNECELINVTKNDKMCRNNGTTVVTDKYQIDVRNWDVTITWKTNWTNLSHLKSLNLLHTINMARELNIDLPKEVQEKTFVRSHRYIKALNLYKVHIINMAYINENEVYTSSGPKWTFINLPGRIKNPSTFFTNYLSETMTNLKEISFMYRGTITLRTDTFQRNTQLESIEFQFANLENLNRLTFENLTSLKKLHFYHCSLEDQSFLRSTALQNYLDEIYLFVDQKIDINHFQNYKILKMIKINYDDRSHYVQRISKTNLTLFICTSKSLDLCYFNIGKNGKRCPRNCTCGLDDLRKNFILNCTRQGLTKIPELPVPSTGEAILHFEGNGLTELPNTRLAGYNNVRQLHLANNNLSEVTIDQVPQNLTIMDIRNNSINSLEPRVAKFLLERMDKAHLIQSGINWISNCKNEDLLSYLKYLKTNNLVNYHHLKGPCPKDCSCCVNGTHESQFIINCTGKTLRTFPRLPNKIKGDSLLLLDDSLIDSFPTLSLRNSSLGALHMKNNSLTQLQLDQLPSNLKVLDIRGNNLTELDDDVTQFISKLKEIQLSGNPWQCSCKFTKFLGYLRENHLTEYKVALRNCSGQEECPDLCTCCKEDDTLRFIINCSSKGLTEIPPLPITENATLLFDHNELTDLKKSSLIKGFDQLMELHLKSNRLIELDNVPHNIQFLDIRNNSLSKLNKNLTKFLTDKSNSSSLTLLISGNWWICHCKEIELFRFTKSLARNIKDLCLTQCTNSKLFVNLEEKDLCPPGIPFYVIIFTSFIILSVLLSFLQCFWKPIRMWLYEKSLFMKLTARLEVYTDTIYDCFLAYCHKDSHLVKEYVDRLENGRNKLRLCFYERDWLAGEPIPDSICNSVENSKCTVIIMTSHFLKSVWGRLEFRLALHATSKDPNKRLIVIVYPGVENFDQLDNELASYMKLNTYLMRSDVNFWNKLMYALPHKTVDSNDGIEGVGIFPANNFE